MSIPKAVHHLTCQLSWPARVRFPWCLDSQSTVTWRWHVRRGSWSLGVTWQWRAGEHSTWHWELVMQQISCVQEEYSAWFSFVALIHIHNVGSIDVPPVEHSRFPFPNQKSLTMKALSLSYTFLFLSSWVFCLYRSEVPTTLDGYWITWICRRRRNSSSR